jgi:predicted dehydrogenase
MKVLIVGLGSIARKHISTLHSLQSDFNIFALRSKPNAAIEKGVVNVYELNDEVQFDFAIISNPTHLHYEYIEKLAHKGIPLFIEKPAIHSLSNADKLVQLIADKKVVTYVACNLRFHPCIAFLKNKLDSESLKINEVNVYCGSYLPYWRPGKDFRTIYSANAALGGGVHLDLFHELDYTTWFFGLPNSSSSLIRNVSSLNIDAIDYANYSFQYPSFTANIILNYYRRKPKRQIEIVLEEDTWSIDLLKNEIKNDNDEYLFKESDFNVMETYSKQLAYFIDCLKNKNLPMNSFKESIKILKICLKDE